MHSMSNVRKRISKSAKMQCIKVSKKKLSRTTKGTEKILIDVKDATSCSFFNQFRADYFSSSPKKPKIKSKIAKSHITKAQTKKKLNAQKKVNQKNTKNSLISLLNVNGLFSSQKTNTMKFKNSKNEERDNDNAQIFDQCTKTGTKTAENPINPSKIGISIKKLKDSLKSSIRDPEMDKLSNQNLNPTKKLLSASSKSVKPDKINDEHIFQAAVNESGFSNYNQATEIVAVNVSKIRPFSHKHGLYSCESSDLSCAVNKSADSKEIQTNVTKKTSAVALMKEKQCKESHHCPTNSDLTSQATINESIMDKLVKEFKEAISQPKQMKTTQRKQNNSKRNISDHKISKKTVAYDAKTTRRARCKKLASFRSKLTQNKIKRESRLVGCKSLRINKQSSKTDDVLRRESDCSTLIKANDLTNDFKDAEQLCKNQNSGSMSPEIRAIALFDNVNSFYSPNSKASPVIDLENGFIEREYAKKAPVYIKYDASDQNPSVYSTNGPEYVSKSSISNIMAVEIPRVNCLKHEIKDLAVNLETKESNDMPLLTEKDGLFHIDEIDGRNTTCENSFFEREISIFNAQTAKNFKSLPDSSLNKNDLAKFRSASCAENSKNDSSKLDAFISVECNEDTRKNSTCKINYYRCIKSLGTSENVGSNVTSKNKSMNFDNNSPEKCQSSEKNSLQRLREVDPNKSRKQKPKGFSKISCRKKTQRVTFRSKTTKKHISKTQAGSKKNIHYVHNASKVAKKSVNSSLAPLFNADSDKHTQLTSKKIVSHTYEKHDSIVSNKKVAENASKDCAHIFDYHQISRSDGQGVFHVFHVIDSNLQAHSNINPKSANLSANLKIVCHGVEKCEKLHKKVINIFIRKHPDNLSHLSALKKTDENKNCSSIVKNANTMFKKLLCVNITTVGEISPMCDAQKSHLILPIYSGNICDEQMSHNDFSNTGKLAMLPSSGITREFANREKSIQHELNYQAEEIAATRSLSPTKHNTATNQRHDVRSSIIDLKKAENIFFQMLQTEIIEQVQKNSQNIAQSFNNKLQSNSNDCVSTTRLEDSSMKIENKRRETLIKSCDIGSTREEIPLTSNSPANVHEQQNSKNSTGPYNLLESAAEPINCDILSNNRFISHENDVFNIKNNQISIFSEHCAKIRRSLTMKGSNLSECKENMDLQIVNYQKSQKATDKTMPPIKNRNQNQKPLKKRRRLAYVSKTKQTKKFEKSELESARMLCNIHENTSIAFLKENNMLKDTSVPLGCKRDFAEFVSTKENFSDDLSTNALVSTNVITGIPSTSCTNEVFRSKNSFTILNGYRYEVTTNDKNDLKRNNVNIKEIQNHEKDLQFTDIVCCQPRSEHLKTGSNPIEMVSSVKNRESIKGPILADLKMEILNTAKHLHSGYLGFTQGTDSLDYQQHENINPNRKGIESIGDRSQKDFDGIMLTEMPTLTNTSYQKSNLIPNCKSLSDFDSSLKTNFLSQKATIVLETLNHVAKENFSISSSISQCSSTNEKARNCELMAKRNLNSPTTVDCSLLTPYNNHENSITTFEIEQHVSSKVDKMSGENFGNEDIKENHNSYGGCSLILNYNFTDNNTSYKKKDHQIQTYTNQTAKTQTLDVQKTNIDEHSTLDYQTEKKNDLSSPCIVDTTNIAVWKKTYFDPTEEYDSRKSVVYCSEDFFKTSDLNMSSCTVQSFLSDKCSKESVRYSNNFLEIAGDHLNKDITKYGTKPSLSNNTSKCDSSTKKIMLTDATQQSDDEYVIFNDSKEVFLSPLIYHDTLSQIRQEHVETTKESPQKKTKKHYDHGDPNFSLKVGENQDRNAKTHNISANSSKNYKKNELLAIKKHFESERLFLNESKNTKIDHERLHSVQDKICEIKALKHQTCDLYTLHEETYLFTNSEKQVAKESIKFDQTPSPNICGVIYAENTTEFVKVESTGATTPHINFSNSSDYFFKDQNVQKLEESTFMADIDTKNILEYLKHKKRSIFLDSNAKLMAKSINIDPNPYLTQNVENTQSFTAMKRNPISISSRTLLQSNSNSFVSFAKEADLISRESVSHQNFICQEFHPHSINYTKNEPLVSHYENLPKDPTSNNEFKGFDPTTTKNIQKINFVKKSNTVVNISENASCAKFSSHKNTISFQNKPKLDIKNKNYYLRDCNHTKHTDTTCFKRQINDISHQFDSAIMHIKSKTNFQVNNYKNSKERSINDIKKEMDMLLGMKATPKDAQESFLKSLYPDSEFLVNIIQTHERSNGIENVCVEKDKYLKLSMKSGKCESEQSKAHFLNESRETYISMKSNDSHDKNCSQLKYLHLDDAASKQHLFADLVSKDQKTLNCLDVGKGIHKTKKESESSHKNNVILLKHIEGIEVPENTINTTFYGLKKSNSVGNKVHLGKFTIRKSEVETLDENSKEIFCGFNTEQTEMVHLRQTPKSTEFTDKYANCPSYELNQVFHSSSDIRVTSNAESNANYKNSCDNKLLDAIQDIELTDEFSAKMKCERAKNHVVFSTSDFLIDDSILKLLKRDSKVSKRSITNPLSVTKVIETLNNDLRYEITEAKNEVDKLQWSGSGFHDVNLEDEQILYQQKILFTNGLQNPQSILALQNENMKQSVSFVKKLSIGGGKILPSFNTREHIIKNTPLLQSSDSLDTCSSKNNFKRDEMIVNHACTKNEQRYPKKIHAEITTILEAPNRSEDQTTYSAEKFDPVLNAFKEIKISSSQPVFKSNRYLQTKVSKKISHMESSFQTKSTIFRPVKTKNISCMISKSSKSLQSSAKIVSSEYIPKLVVPSIVNDKIIDYFKPPIWAQDPSYKAHLLTFNHSDLDEILNLDETLDLHRIFPDYPNITNESPNKWTGYTP